MYHKVVCLEKKVVSYGRRRAWPVRLYILVKNWSKTLPATSYILLKESSISISSTSNSHKNTSLFSKLLPKILILLDLSLLIVLY